MLLACSVWVSPSLVPVASFTITKLAWPAARVDQVVLRHDRLNGALSGIFTTHRSDTSGAGYFSSLTDSYRADLLERFLGRSIWGAGRGYPERLGIDGAVLAASAGDNAAAALGLGLRSRGVVVSIATSGTVFISTPSDTHDLTGSMFGSADATDAHLSLLAMLNSARVLTAAAAMLDVDLPKLDGASTGRGP